MVFFPLAVLIASVLIFLINIVIHLFSVIYEKKVITGKGDEEEIFELLEAKNPVELVSLRIRELEEENDIINRDLKLQSMVSLGDIKIHTKKDVEFHLADMFSAVGTMNVPMRLRSDLISKINEILSGSLVLRAALKGNKILNYDFFNEAFVKACRDPLISQNDISKIPDGFLHYSWFKFPKDLDDAQLRVLAILKFVRDSTLEMTEIKCFQMLYSLLPTKPQPSDVVCNINYANYLKNSNIKIDPPAEEYIKMLFDFLNDPNYEFPKINIINACNMPAVQNFKKEGGAIKKTLTAEEMRKKGEAAKAAASGKRTAQAKDHVERALQIIDDAKGIAEASLGISTESEPKSPRIDSISAPSKKKGIPKGRPTEPISTDLQSESKASTGAKLPAKKKGIPKALPTEPIAKDLHSEAKEMAIERTEDEDKGIAIFNSMLNQFAENKKSKDPDSGFVTKPGFWDQIDIQMIPSDNISEFRRNYALLSPPIGLLNRDTPITRNMLSISDNTSSNWVTDLLNTRGFTKVRDELVHKVAHRLSDIHFRMFIKFLKNQEEINKLKGLDPNCLDLSSKKVRSMRQEIEELSKLSNSVADLKAMQTLYKEELERSTSLKAKLDSANESIETMKTMVETANMTSDTDLREIDSLKSKLRESKKEVKELNQKLEESESKMKSIQIKINNIEDSFENERKENEKSLEEIRKLKQTNEELADNSVKLMNEADDISRRYRILYNAKNALEQELEEANKDKESLSSKLKDLDSDNKYLLEKEDRFMKNMEAMPFVRTDILNIKNKVVTSTRKLADLKEELMITQSNIAKLSKTKSADIKKIVTSAIDLTKKKIEKVLDLNDRISEILSVTSSIPSKVNRLKSVQEGAIDKLAARLEDVNKLAAPFLVSNGAGFEYLKQHIENLTIERKKIIDDLTPLVKGKIDIDERVRMMKRLEEIDKEMYNQSIIVKRYNMFAVDMFEDLQKIEDLDYSSDRTLLNEYKDLLDHYKKFSTKFSRTEEMNNILRSKNSELTEMTKTLESSVNALSMAGKDPNTLVNFLKEQVSSLTKEITELNKKGSIIDFDVLKLEHQAKIEENEALREKYNDLLGQMDTEREHWRESLINAVDTYSEELSTEIDQMMVALDISSVNPNPNLMNVSMANVRKKQLYVLETLKLKLSELETARSESEALKSRVEDLEKELKESNMNIKAKEIENLELRQLAGETIDSVEPIKTFTEKLNAEKQRLEELNADNESKIKTLSRDLDKAKALAPKGAAAAIDLMLQALAFQNVNKINVEPFFKHISPWGVRFALIASYIKNAEREDHHHNAWKSKIKILSRLNKSGKGDEDDLEYYNGNSDDETDEWDKPIPKPDDSIPDNRFLSEKIQIEEPSENDDFFKFLERDAENRDITDEQSEFVSIYLDYKLGKLPPMEDAVIEAMLQEFENLRLKELYPDDMIATCKETLHHKVFRVDTKPGAITLMEIDDKYLPLVLLSDSIIEFYRGHGLAMSRQMVSYTALEENSLDLLLAASLVKALHMLRIRSDITELEIFEKNARNQVREMIKDITTYISKNSWFMSKIRGIIGIEKGSAEDLLNALEERLNNFSDKDVMEGIQKRINTYRKQFNLLNEPIREAIIGIDETIQRIKKIKEHVANHSAKDQEVQRLKKKLSELEASMADKETALKDAQDSDLLKKTIELNGCAADKEDLKKTIAEMEKTKDSFISELNEARKSLEMQAHMQEMAAHDPVTISTLQSRVRLIKQKLIDGLMDSNGLTQESPDEDILKAVSKQRLDAEEEIDTLKKQIEDLVQMNIRNASSDADKLSMSVTAAIGIAIGYIDESSKKIVVISDSLEQITDKWRQHKISLDKYIQMNNMLEEKLLQQGNKMESMQEEIDEFNKTKDNLEAYKLAYSILSNDKDLLETLTSEEVDSKKAMTKDVLDKISIVEKSLPGITNSIENIFRKMDKRSIDLQTKLIAANQAVVKKDILNMSLKEDLKIAELRDAELKKKIEQLSAIISKDSSQKDSELQTLRDEVSRLQKPMEDIDAISDRIRNINPDDISDSELANLKTQKENMVKVVREEVDRLTDSLGTAVETQKISDEAMQLFDELKKERDESIRKLKEQMDKDSMYIEDLKEKISASEAKVSEMKAKVLQAMNEKDELIKLSDNMAKAGTLSIGSINEIKKLSETHRSNVINMNFVMGNILNTVSSMSLKLKELESLQPINQRQKEELQLAISELKTKELLKDAKTVDKVLEAISTINSTIKTANNLSTLVGSLPSKIINATSVNKLVSSTKEVLVDTELQALLMTLVPGVKNRAELIESIKNIINDKDSPEVIYEEIYYPVEVVRKRPQKRKTRKLLE